MNACKRFIATACLLMLIAAALSGCGQKEKEAFALARGEGTYEAYLRFANEYPENSEGRYALSVVGLVTGQDPDADQALGQAVELAPESVKHGYELRSNYRQAVKEADQCTSGCSSRFIDCSLTVEQADGEIDFEALDRCTKALGLCSDGCDGLIAKSREEAEIYSTALGLIEHDASLTILALEREQIVTP